MKYIYLKYSIVFFGLLALSACGTEDDLRDDIIDNSNNPFVPVEVAASAGNTSFAKYVAVGASITSGLMDGALYTTGQDNSYPNLLSAQFALADGGNFAQPDIGSNIGFNILLNDLSTAFESAENGKFKLDASIPAPSPVRPGEPLSLYTGNVNNFGVPGARLVDATANGYGAFNPFYARFAATETSSILEEALAAAPTFYTLWLGANDVLGYASSGGATRAATNAAPIPPDNLVVGINASGPIFQPNVTQVAPGVFLALNQIPGITDYYQTFAPANTSSTTPTELADPSGITNQAVFEAAYTGVLGALDAGADGVAINIPDVALAPTFNLIPIDLLKVPIDLSVVLPDAIRTSLGFPEGATFATALNTIYAQFGFANDPSTGLPTRQIFESSSDNGLVIETFDENGNRIFRQISSGDKVLLSIPLDSLAIGWGSLTGIVLDESGNIDLEATDLTALRPFPIPSQYILDANELASLKTNVNAYNEIIDRVAGTFSVPVVDIQSILLNAALNGGYEVSNQLLSYDFSPNGFFSVDGVHPNARGQGIVANSIIEAINDTYSATLPDVDIIALPGITLK